MPLRSTLRPLYLTYSLAHVWTKLKVFLFFEFEEFVFSAISLFVNIFGIKVFPVSLSSESCSLVYSASGFS